MLTPPIPARPQPLTKDPLPTRIPTYREASGVDARRIHSIVHGERAITAETALLLARFFGNSAGFWMGLQSQYDLELTQDRLSERLDRIHRVDLQSPKTGVRYTIQADDKAPVG